MANKRKGQGLVEFALILPVILLLFCVIIESGRIFHAYTTVQHAAREGGRFAVTGQELEDLGLNRVESIKYTARQATGSLMVDPDKYWAAGAPDAWPYYNQAGSLLIVVQGPDGVNTAGGPGEPVRVHVEHTMPIITPLLMPIAKYVRVVGEVEMVNEGFGATGASHGGVPSPPLPTLPTSGPTPENTATNTPGGPVETPTESSSPSPTLTPPPTLVPLYLDKPIVVGDTQIAGGGEPGQQVLIRDLQARQELGTATIDGSGRFTLNFTVDASRVGHTIVALGYGQVDYAEVLGGTPTETPTPTETVGPTPTPIGGFITLATSCGDPGTTTITVFGHQWLYQNNNDDISIEWDGTEVKVLDASTQPGFWSTSITVDVTAGTHIVRAVNSKSDGSATYQSPCVEPTGTATSTPTPAPPDIVVDSVATAAPVYAGMPAVFNVTVRNQGLGPVNSMFWNDLYIDPDGPVSSDYLFIQLGSPSNVDWTGVSSLAPGDSLTVQMTYQQGFTATGSIHQVYALADSIKQIDETDDTNNHNSVEVTVLEPIETLTPSPTATETPTPGGPTEPPPGSISGATWIWVGSNWTVPQGRVVVKCWQGSTLIATTYSQDGYYLLNDIPAGTGYKVTGEIWIDGTRYYDERVNITVESGLETRYVDLLLVPASAEPTDTPPSPTGTLTETPTQIEPTSTVTPTVPTATATITPTVPTEVPSNEIWLEAECGTVGSNFEVHADGSASNGGYVEVQNGYNSTGSAPQDVPANRVRLTFSLDEAGTYRVWGRVQAPSANDDSFWVRIDGSSTWYQWNNIEPGGNWHWDEVHDSEHGDTVVDFNLAAGSHTLDFAYREDGTRLDKVYITNTGDTPSGLGGTAPSCSVSVPTTIAWDDFEDRWWNWDGGSGWTGVWDHGGSSEIYNYGYNWRLQVRDDDGWAARTVNMSGVTGAHMQFIWRASSFESGEWAEVEIYDGSWHQVLAVYNGQDDGDWHNVDVDLSSYNMPGNFQVRVRAHMGNDQDYFYIDDLVITGSR